MGRPVENTDLFRNLTWDDLNVWAGTKVVSRGKRYQKSKRVLSLSRTTDHHLVAWVAGTRKYATTVALTEEGLTSLCTCPYTWECKHAVAVVIEYLEHLRAGKAVGLCRADDERLALLADWRRADGETEIVKAPPPSPGRARKKGPDPVAAYLAGLSKVQLVALIEDLATSHRPVQDKLKDLAALSAGEVKTLVAAIRKEIRDLSAEPGWNSHWSGKSSIPDYSRVKDRLEALLSRGHADEVLELGKELLDKGGSQVEMSDDDGETAEELASAMEIVFCALPVSSMKPSERMLWVVEAEIRDQYDLCRGAQDFWALPHKAGDWSLVADRLLERLGKLPKSDKEGAFERNYGRDRLSNWIIRALGESGRQDEIIPLCKEETPVTGSYDRLVRMLMEAEMWDDAEEWIAKGIKATQNALPGIASALRNQRLTIREKLGDWHSVAMLRAEKFLDHPSLDTYRNLRDAASRAGLWEDVRKSALAYLETGRVEGSTPPWPASRPGQAKLGGPHVDPFPRAGALTDIFIEEGNPEEVLRWHQKSTERKYGSGFDREDRVAVALSKTYPDTAVTIWKRLAEKQIAQTNPKAYQQAGMYLRKIRQLLTESGKKTDWLDLLAEIRRSNLRKKRLLEVLDGLEKKPIIRQ